MVTFEDGKSYSIQFKILNNGPIFDSILNETRSHTVAKMTMRCGTTLILGVFPLHEIAHVEVT